MRTRSQYTDSLLCISRWRTANPLAFIRGGLEVKGNELMTESIGKRSIRGNIRLSLLCSEHARELSTLLSRQRSEYIRFFHPFSFDLKTIEEILGRRREDVFTGIYRQDQLVGFFMLRGWDQGFEVPTFGILIDEGHSELGLARLSLRMAKRICRLRGSPRIMLKVSPENEAAKYLYEEEHFVQTGIDNKSGDLIYHFEPGEGSGEV
jgi:RimJ/RimL family protein N-acetyltransferase